MRNRIWLSLLGAIAVCTVCIGSLNADSNNDKESAAIANQSDGLNLTEQSSSNVFTPYGWSVQYPYLNYYPEYYNAYYPYYGYYGYGYGYGYGYRYGYGGCCGYRVY